MSARPCPTWNAHGHRPTTISSIVRRDHDSITLNLGSPMVNLVNMVRLRSCSNQRCKFSLQIA